MKPDLRNVLKTQILTGDGAMGTYLYQQGFPIGTSYEELNLTNPDVIYDVHRRYYDAGARMIESNTFSANIENLSRYGLEDQVEAINRAGISIAKRAAGAEAYVVGAVGSIRAGKRQNLPVSRIDAAFRQQIGALLEAEADGIMLETFYDLEEILIALRIVRQQSDLPVICQFSVEDGRMRDGATIGEAFQAVRDAGADVIGFNCRSGPHGILNALGQVPDSIQVPMSVYPNAGIPDYVDGKYMYMATPDYFADRARKFADLGARIIGGCCGTTPEHIAAIAEALQGYMPQSPDRTELPQSRESAGRTGVPASAKTAGRGLAVVDGGAAEGGAGQQQSTIIDLVRKRTTVIIELDPPRDLDIDKFMAGAARLHAAGADAVTLADNSLAVTRMSNMALGYLIKDKLGVRPLVHIACRDRNLIGTQSHMMGLDALGIDHVLAVTGDPARFGDLPDSSSVYDLTSFEIIRMIKQLNEGIAFSGKPLKQKAKFIVGAAFNPNVRHLDKMVRRLERKVEAGADYIMTQPVYDPELIIRIHEATRHIEVPIFIGIMPLASGRNAEYLHNEVPGIQLSDPVRARMAGLEGEEGRKVGVEIAKELLDTAIGLFNGIYLITPFLLYEMTAQLTEYILQQTPAQFGR